MADINKDSIKLLSSQRLDDTNEGGGQMTSTEIISGSVNNLYPDISRFDRVYGNVSLRKAFLGVQTNDRATYHGAHIVLTKNADDPNVSVCFFSSADWFDTRDESRARIESYLVKGPFYPCALWGNHWRGTRQLQVHTYKDYPNPEIGDVLVLVENQGTANEHSQYVRITDITSEVKDFTYNQNIIYYKKIINIKIGEMLTEDYEGTEIFWEGASNTLHYGYTGQKTLIYTTVAADASQYYGVSTLSEDADNGSLHVRVESIMTNLVPSAQSQTAITDAGAGQAITPMLQTNAAITSVTRSISFTIAANSKLYIGEGVLPGSFNWTGGLTLNDNSKGDILNNGTVVGSITYATGIVTFTNVTGNSNGTGTVTYIPACSPTEVASTGAIQVDINNRGFVYTYSCDPLPKKGTVKIDFLANGKWYSMQDKGNGSISGFDQSIGSGSVNFITGSISMTLGAMPDVGSMIMIFWAKDAPYYDLSGETLPLRYEFTTTNPGIARNSFYCSWNNEAAAVKDDGDGNLTVGTWNGSAWVKSATVVGTIHYASGKVRFNVHSSQVVPSAAADFHVVYMYGDRHTENFNPGRLGDGSVKMFLTNLPVTPGTFSIVWHTDQEEYDLEVRLTQIRRHIDPTWTFQDNTLGGFKNETGLGLPGSFSSTINYSTGEVHIMPDRQGTFPITRYAWKDTGLKDDRGRDMQTYVFDFITYLPAASIWPTDGIIEVTYCSTSGSTTDDYYIEIPRTFFIKENSHLEIIPGSVDIYAGSTYMIDVGTGRLFRNIEGTTGIGTECGLIDYVKRMVTITDDTISSREITIKSCGGTAAIDPVQMIVFRTPASPVVPGSVSVRGTLGTGVVVTGTSDFTGAITGTGVQGIVDYSTGICRVSFGTWATDIWAAMPVEDRPPWYAGAPIDGGTVWKPYSLRASTIMINCVVTSYLPLNADLLGLDPVRLPMDGKVPIFRDGYVILVHHTLKENLPNPAVKGDTYTMSRGNVNLIELFDSTGLWYPEMNSGATKNYTVNLAAGTVKIELTADYTGFTQPFYAIHRIEDMALASDVQITGHIAITNPLTHDYPKDDTLVSSVLPCGNMQSRFYNEFVQSSWTGVWSDGLIGSAPLANYDFVNFPVTVLNKGATKERWLIRFTSTNRFDVVGEHLGVLISNVFLDGTDPIATTTTSGWSADGTMLHIKNRLTNEDYFVMARAGFGVGWQSGNCIRGNTDAANYPIWFVRTTLQAPPTELTDDYQLQIRGDST